MISVIIPTCNRNDLLSKCLQLLSPLNQTINEDYEVIVSDDSKDNIAKSLIDNNYPWVIWIEGTKKGPAANRNNGAKSAKGDWLVFIDDDCLPKEDILHEYKNGITNYPNNDAFEGSIVPDDWEMLKKDLSECPVNTDGNCFWSANICVNKILFRKIGGFDETYFIAAQEDQQIKLDIEKVSKKSIIFLEKCVVIHPVRFTTISKQLYKIPRSSKNFAIYASKNKNYLGYTSIAKFGLKQYLFHLRSFAYLLSKGKIKSSIVSLGWLIYGIPINIWNYIKMREVE